MSDHRPRYHPNSLPVPRIDELFLRESLQDLRIAVRNSVDLIQEGDPPSKEYDGRGLFSGNLGIALAFLRLVKQAPALTEPGYPHLPAFHILAQERIPAEGPDIPLKIGGLSPLSSNNPLAATVLRVLERAVGSGSMSVSHADVACLCSAIDLALSHGSVCFYHGHNLGADEILFGRAGLLWAILNIRAHASIFSEEERELLLPVFGAVPRLAKAIISAGLQGATDYTEKHGEKDALPLMWTWMEGHYGLGWAHGMTGIIPVLLACQPEELIDGSHNYIAEVAATITGLCRVCIAHHGHLPVSIPARPSTRDSHLVQMCHGSPAILALIGCARKCRQLMLQHWQPEWDEAVRLATECVWKEGLLSKGGGLCHGIAGNAWPLLILHDSFEYSQGLIEEAKKNYRERSSASPGSIDTEHILTGDYFLSRALAMLLHARDTKPYNQSSEGTPHDYRMPDHAYSLFEGLAGTVCAWSETCTMIQARLRKMELERAGATIVEDDELMKEYIQRQLGFPCLGGSGLSRLL